MKAKGTKTIYHQPIDEQIIKSTIKTVDQKPIDQIGIPIVISSAIKTDLNKCHYLIPRDGMIVNGSLDDKNKTVICLIEQPDVNWTQIRSMMKLITELKGKGQMTIHRYDEFYPGECNPVFNLSHCLNKFSVR